MGADIMNKRYLTMSDVPTGRVWPLASVDWGSVGVLFYCPGAECPEDTERFPRENIGWVMVVNEEQYVVLCEGACIPGDGDEWVALLGPDEVFIHENPPEKEG